jgi:HEPN domain-containing protein
MKNECDLARGWLAKAESDFVTARLVLDGPGPYDTACFHAQQAIEKLLKAFLAFHGQPIPRTHDLEELQRLCLQVQQLSDLEGIDLTQLTDYAVVMRYDFDFWPDRQIAADAIATVQHVWQIIRQALPEACYPTNTAIG